MTPTSSQSLSRPKHRRIHRPGQLRFRLLALMLFVTGCSVLLAWWTRPPQFVTEALFRIAAKRPMLMDDPKYDYDPREFDDLRKTHAALAASHFVLAKAARDPAIAKLPVLAAQANPIDWLSERIDVEFANNSELLAIRLSGYRHTLTDDALIVDAVAQAYQQEVVFGDRKHKLSERNVLATSLAKLHGEIRSKLEDYYNLASQSTMSANETRLHFRSVQRMEDEIIRLEGVLLEVKLRQDTVETDDSLETHVEAYEQRIAELQEKLNKLREYIRSHSQESAELDVREEELKVLKQLDNRMAQQLELWDVEMNAPHRIEWVQRASARPK